MQEVHDLAYHGQGGFPISDVWDLPVPYRRYHIRAIANYNKEKQEEIDDLKGKKPLGKSIQKPNIPNKPTYTTNIKS
jgi:hypothetical protein